MFRERTLASEIAYRLRKSWPLIGLYRMAHGGSYDNTALAMNIGKTAVREAFRDVVGALYDIRNEFDKLPLAVDETAASIATFQHLSMLPNIAGRLSYNNQSTEGECC